MAVPSYKSTSLPWNEVALPWQVRPQTIDSPAYSKGHPYKDPRLPWNLFCGPVTFTGLNTASSSADAASYTFSNVTIGDAASDKYIVGAVEFRDTGTNASLSGVTVDGIEATLLGTPLAVTSGGNLSYIGFFRADLRTDSNTTGDIVVTLSETVLRCGVQYGFTSGLMPAIYGAEATDTPVSGAAYSGTVSVPADSFVLAALLQVSTTATVTWSLATENGDEFVDSAVVLSSAYENFTNQNSVTVTATASTTMGASGNGMRVAAFIGVDPE